MPWKDRSVAQLAKALGVNQNEVREKQQLIDLIVSVRKDLKMSQAKLADNVGVTQGRIAQIESGVGTARVSFDVLLNLLAALGYRFRIVTTKAA
ncbi:MAG: helix-turn-helix transcriptional regulator [Pseudomonadota bacterium]